MKLLIAADMEGVSGVVNWEQVKPGTSEWQRFRRIMTEDVNAAISGAMESGVDEVIVSDGHWNGDNIMIDLLDPRARLNCGSPKPYSMLQGIDQDVDVAFFIGYHARVGTQLAILDHTWSNIVVGNVWLNDYLVGETGLNAALAGHFNVPILMISGDLAVNHEAKELIPRIQSVVVKQANSRFSADCLHPKEAQNLIREGARLAIQAYQNGEGSPVFKVKQPIQGKVELKSTELADRAQIVPGVQRISARDIVFQSEDMPAAYRTFRTVVGLAG
ncbi:MAG: M55 family metallopeptidase [Anaerolineaceae bacterium]|nr:M55 family metallopeptidase [Anaerolineaceae bacterium]